MAFARWRALCMDAQDAAKLAGFWASVLGLSPSDGNNGSIRLDGATEDQQVWVDPVPEPKSVKHRVHLDVEVGDLDGIQQLGATVIRPPGGDRTWWVMADVEGGEFCAFIRDGRDSLPGRLYEVVVDSAEPDAISAWWGELMGLKREDNALSGALPYDYLCFGQVPEPKTVKNRVHWDVVAPDVSALVNAGARMLRDPDDDIFWHVLADPEGNEFCAFAD
jgi:hypothetical protein